MLKTAVDTNINLKVANVYKPLWKNAKRRNYIYGGRGSGKSHDVAEYCLFRAYQAKIKVLCTRELQNSIADSVYSLLKNKITDMKLDFFFTVYKDRIVGNNGSEFIFKGIHNNVSEIKSMENISIAWLEESQSLSRESIDVIVPTIRAPGSILIFTFNPYKDNDPIYMEMKNATEDDLVIKANYSDNPWFPEELRLEMERDKKNDYQKYLWVWEGECLGLSDAQIFRGKYVIENFETPKNADFHFGADWGFACLEGNTLVTTNKGLKKLRDIKVGDHVLTRQGYKKVLATKNKGLKKVFDLDCGYGKRIIVTGDHKIYTSDGWKRVDELGARETLCETKLSLMGAFINAIRTVSTRIISTGKKAKTEKTAYASFTGIFTNIIKGLFLKVTSFTTLTVILLITVLKTLCALPLLSIVSSISSLNFTKKKLQLQDDCTDIQKRTGQNEEKNQSLLYKLKEEYAKNVEKALQLRTYIKSFVVQSAENTVIKEIAKKSVLVKYAVKSLWQQLTNTKKLVLKNVHINLQPLTEEREVFDIAVEDCHEFVANGVLVHNCDPTTLVRSFIVGNDLYIDMCAGKVGCDLEDTPSLFNEVQGSSIYPIYADSARPETISFMRSKHYNVIAAEKWNGSVEDGIQYLRSFSCIHIHERCKAVAEEFDLYQYKVDRQTGEVLRVPVDKFNHYIDAIRYSLTVSMRSANNGKVYDNFRVENICKDERASGDVYLGTFALPGRILWVSACVISGEIKILDAFSQSVIDFKAVKDKYPDCNLVWMPYTTLKDIQQNYVDDCVDNDIEPAVPGILPAEGEGTKLVNDLFDRHSLSIMESAWTLISCLNERVFLADGKIERSSKEQENARFCKTFEYLVWRIMGRLQNE